MTTYKDSGVDIVAGDEASRRAYAAAKQTFGARHGKIGTPVVFDRGFTGLLDFGDFYLVQNDDGIGSKLDIAYMVRKFDTLGYDLVAMVADDAVCVGAEVVSITNTIDTNKVNPDHISEMMHGLAEACGEQKIVVPGGEVAELPSLCRGTIWNATAVGIVEKDKFIDCGRIKEGDAIIGLASHNFRSNGFSLVRHILKTKFGDNWYHEKYSSDKTWADVLMEPSIVYHDFLLSMLGRYGEARQIDIKGLAHITGGGIPGNFERILHGTLGANLDLPEPPHVMSALAEMGNVEREEAYTTWNMGIGMMMVTAPGDSSQVLDACKKAGFDGRLVGEIVDKPGIVF